jgi:hypothetical protein
MLRAGGWQEYARGRIATGHADCCDGAREMNNDVAALTIISLHVTITIYIFGVVKFLRSREELRSE